MCSKTHSDSSKCSHPPSPMSLDSRNKTNVSSSTFSTRRAIKTTCDPCPPRNNMIPRHVRRTRLRIRTVVCRTRSRVIFDSQVEFLAYCESDVLLLKDACQCQEYEEISGFNRRNGATPSPPPARTTPGLRTLLWLARARKTPFSRRPGMVDLLEP